MSLAIAIFESKVYRVIKSITSLIKSRTLVYVFAIVSLGTFLISSGPQVPNLLVMSELVFSVYFLALATYLYNDLTDYSVDRTNNRKTPSSDPSRYRTTFYVTLFFFAISILSAFAINIQTGIASIAFLIIAITYSHPKTHLKDRFVVKTVATAAGGAIASLMGYTASDSISYAGLIPPFIAFMFWFTLGPLGDISDIRGDRENGRKTFPIVLGICSTFRLMYLAIFSIMAGIFVMYYVNAINVTGLILSLSTCVFTIFVIKRVSKQYENKKIIKQSRTMLRYNIFIIQFVMFVGLVLDKIQVHN
ncbi:MAG: UbiA family prenyltransferase [Nitrososphaera sp.]|jgi:geranylgeranylglycerol-phosphate geranylgeranyltransferase